MSTPILDLFFRELNEKLKHYLANVSSLTKEMIHPIAYIGTYSIFWDNGYTSAIVFGL